MFLILPLVLISGSTGHSVSVKYNSVTLVTFFLGLIQRFSQHTAPAGIAGGGKKVKNHARSSEGCDQEHALAKRATADTSWLCTFWGWIALCVPGWPHGYSEEST